MLITSENKVVVIGANHHNTLGVIRSLGKKGIYSILIIYDVNKSFIAHSKFVESVNYIKSINELTNALLLLKNNFKNKAVLISCSDSVSQEIDQNRKKLEMYYFVPGISESKKNVAYFEDKENQRILANDIGFLTPKSYLLTSESKIENICYPCIVKPLSSVDSSKNEIKICNTKCQLTEALKQTTRTYQVQEYINKKSEFQLIGISTKDDFIIPGFTNIIRQPNNTNTGYLKYSPFYGDFISKNKISLFLKKIGYVGLFSIEFISNDDGIYFMEINMRNDGNAYVVTKAGVNLPYLWYCYCVNLSMFAIEPKNFTKDIFFMPEFQDIKNIGKNVGVLKWIYQFIQAKAHTVWSINDPLPFIIYILSKI